MILHCTFEELSAVAAGAERVLAENSGAGVVVAAPPEVVADIEALRVQLLGDISINTLTEQRAIWRALAYVLADARSRVDSAILDSHPGSEEAVQAYFDFSHVLVVEDRVRRLGEQMTALIELMTGAPPDAESSKLTFPD